MRSGMCLRTFDEHWDSVESVALSADGRWALTASERTLRLWDVSGLRDKGQTLIASFALCRLADTKETLIVQKQFHALLSAAREALSEGNFARAWSLAAESKTLAGYGFATEATDMARQAGLRGKRNRLRSASCWRALNEKTHSTALSADGRWFLSGGDSTISLWEVSSGKYLRGFDGHSGLVRAVALSADSRWAVSGSNDATVRFWEVGSGKCLGIFSGHTGHVNSVALSTDGRWALSGSSDKTLRLWDLSSGKCLRIFEGNTEEVASVALSADGRWALSGSGVTLRLWEVSSGECLRTFGRHRQQHASKWALWKWIDSRKGALSASVPEGEHAAPVCSVALSADGRWALSGSNDNTLRLWEVRSARCHKILRGHTGHVNSVALSPDGRWALSGSHDKTLRLWDLGTGKCLRIFEGHTREVRSSALSSDGRWVLSGSWDDTLRVWELEWDHEFPEQKDWDEAAKPYLEIFLNTHCVVGVDGFTRVGKPTWAEDDFEKLLVDLQYNSYGWLRPEGVRNQLEQMMREWQGPTLMPWEQKP
jgi:WD40 repeat protein